MCQRHGFGLRWQRSGCKHRRRDADPDRGSVRKAAVLSRRREAASTSSTPSGNKISIIDTSSKKVIGGIPTGKGPGRIALTPDGKTLSFTTCNSSLPSASRISPPRGKSAQIPLSGRPVSLIHDDERPMRVFWGFRIRTKWFSFRYSIRKIEEDIWSYRKAAAPIRPSP